jgi:hypothetical protein
MDDKQQSRARPPARMDRGGQARRCCLVARSHSGPAAAPLLVVGATLAGIAATREDWPIFGLALAVVSVGVGASFAGPAGAWAVAGTGLFIAVLGHAAPPRPGCTARRA